MFSFFINKSKQSKFYLWLFNRVHPWIIPFNRPHGVTITNFEEDSIEVKIPYVRANFNHIRGIHACALATLAEFTSGMMLISKLGQENFRIIMSNLNVEYSYQAKTDVAASYSIDDTWLDENIRRPLDENDSVSIDAEVVVRDTNNNTVCFATATWQIKAWEDVKTKK